MGAGSRMARKWKREDSRDRMVSVMLGVTAFLLLGMILLHPVEMFQLLRRVTDIGRW